jgi:hypothetical protein
MLARRLTTILPAMTLAEAIETTRIHRVVGLTDDRTALVTTRPFRAPHHTISDVGLIGGGHVPMPGSQLWILPLTCHHGSAVADVAAAGVEGPIGGAAGRGRPSAGRSAPRCRAAGSPVPRTAVHDSVPGRHRRTALDRATRLTRQQRHPTSFLRGLDPHASHALTRTPHGFTMPYAGVIDTRSRLTYTG